MPVLLFRLRNVPDDEADDIRILLSGNNIDFYETSAGSWGISLPSIWLPDEKQLHQAKLLIEIYQQEKQSKAKEELTQLYQKGEQRTIADLVKETPLRAALYLVAILLILYISLIPFLNMFR